MPHKGYKQTKEHKENNKQANLGKKSLTTHKQNCQCAFCKAQRGELKGRRGVPHTLKAKEKLRQKALEQFKDGMPQETKDKIRKANSGKNHADFINGLTKLGNRWYVWDDRRQKRIRQARYIAEQFLGRELTSSEIVHHINKDTLDDRPENLYLFPSQSEHMSQHQMKNPPFLISNLI